MILIILLLKFLFDVYYEFKNGCFEEDLETLWPLPYSASNSETQKQPQRAVNKQNTKIPLGQLPNIEFFIYGLEI